MGSEEKVFRNDSLISKICYFWVNLIDRPITWFRENVVVPNRQEYYWYHEKRRRVPTVDECYTDDVVCHYEANFQYELDKRVDKQILQILKKRYDYCMLENSQEKHTCAHLLDIWDRSLTNFFIKYGDLGMAQTAVDCYMKQKHRMAWERRHGPVGSGKRTEEEKMKRKMAKASEEKTC